MIEAVLDACVLYSAPLRDLWMHLTVSSVFQPKWTPRIQDEWIRNVLNDRPDLRPEQLARTRDCMERWGRDWALSEESGLEFQLQLPDSDDRHVLAAAISGGVPIIVTFNLADFPARTLAGYGVRPVHPDAFATELLEAFPAAFLLAVRTHRAALRNPPKNAEQYLEAIRRVGLSRTVERLWTFAPEL